MQGGSPTLTPPRTETASTLVEALRRRAQSEPGRRAYLFLADGEEEAGSLDYAGLDERARAIAAALQRSGRPGDRVLLLYPPGLDFVAAFFGCLYAGRVAVPAYPPRSPRTLPRLQSILEDCAPAVALATTASAARVKGWLERAGGREPLPWLTTDDLPPGLAGEWRDPALRGDDLAFLQYTSGSTSAPKGVMVSHANLAHNQRVIQEACDHSSDSVFVTWLPLYHDLGLIGNLLQATWVGAPCVLMAPVAFLQKPSRWLEAIARYGGTTSGGPNFAYDLCVRKIPPAERARLGAGGLRSWRVAFNGAEPVRAETLARFAEAFAPAGFRAASLYPCYGLAEATLMVSGGRPDAPHVARRFDPEALADHRAVPAGPDGRELVGSGHILSDLRVAIAEPASGEPRPPDGIGEIWVAGGSVARGYWNRPEETAATFGACLAGDVEGFYLRTGDLGFLKDGELFVTGRLKDLIILRGRNHYPQDIEATVLGSHPALTGTGAAFSIEDGDEERLVVVQEIKRHPDARPEAVEEIAEAVRRAVAREHEAYVHELVLVSPGGVPKTTSGKVQRRACRALYETGELKPVGASRLAAAPDTVPGELQGAGTALSAVAGEERLAFAESWLRRTFARLARVDPARLDPERPLAGFGLDSLVAVELKNAAEAELGASLSIAALLEGMSLAEAAREAVDSLASGAIGSVPEEIGLLPAGNLPLSYGQRSLWFLHQLAPESAAYNIAGAARLRTPVDPEALRRVFQALVDRHPALRTTYAEGPVQHVHSGMPADFIHEDAAGWRPEELRDRLHETAFRPFDLERGPLLRTALFERGEESFLVLSVHHIAADFWSLAVLARELGALTSGATPADLPALDLQYADWALWQERRLDGPEGERLWGYWRERLESAPPLDLPADRPRPPAQSFRGAAASLRLDAAAAEAVRELAREHGATLFMTLLAGFQALLGRYSGQEDFLVGSPTSGRSAGGLGERLAGLVGYFVNPVALRADLTGDPTVAEALARMRREALGAFEHQDFPFALLAERLQPERDPGRPALVQTMLGLEKAPSADLAPLAAFALGEAGARLDLGGLKLESVALESPAAQLDLTLLAAELDGGLAFSLQYSTDLFDAATAERLLAHLGNLLPEMAARPDRRLAELPMLSPAERRQAVVEWNRTSGDYPREVTVHRLFEELARQEPERTALIENGLEIPYRELEERANRLARHLRGLGVGPETQVGTALERSAGMIIAFLAILKAGGAYVPLDPAYPRERLALMAGEVALPFVLTEERLLGSLPFQPDRVLCLDREAAAIAAQDARPLDAVDIEVSPRNLAYVMFTSGSTGRPKAVGVEHRSIVRLVRGTNFLRFEPGQTFLQLAPASFDAATLEIWGPLLNGGRLVLFPGRAPSLAELGEAVAGVDVLWATTGLFHQIVESRLEILRMVRHVLTGGEVLSPEAFNRVLAEVPGCAPTAFYGPTENTTFTTFHPVREPIPPGGSVPIGTPIANTQAYVVDRALQPVPPGVPGELLTGGDGLARGYLGRPDATAERFVPSPFAAETGEPGARLYRTGDLVRRRADGVLEFLARLDQQVKIRGFRVEPGEIEIALASHPGVREAAVLVRSDGPAGKRLAAYVAAPGLSAAELRAFLRDRLPEYMVPAAFAVLESLPLNANGKVDRGVLARLEATPALPAGGGSAFVAPRNPAEEVVAEVWADLLGAERVGIHDDFFELGGHSLLATRAMARLREPFGVELPLSALFAKPTVQGLAAAIERARGAGEAQSKMPPLVPVPRGEGLPLSFAQERLWFLDRLAPGGAVYNIPAALELHGDLRPAALASAFTEAVHRHEALRTVFAASGGLPVQRPLPPVAVPLPGIDLAGLPSDLREAEATRLETEEARRPFDLEAGPLLRASLLRLGPGVHRLLLGVHHIAADGWSMDRLLGDLSALYSGSPLPELPVQYADFAVWQRAWFAGGVLEPQIAWWREQLAGMPDALDLPADRPRPAAQTYRGGAVPAALSPDLARRLRTAARGQGATLFMGLVAGFAALLHRYTGAEELAVGSAVANRRRPELDPLVGFFVNLLPLPARLQGDPTGAALIGRVREAALGAYAHQDVPFERLVEELRPHRDLSRSPLFQALVALQDGPATRLRLPGVEPAALRLMANGTSKFDLSLTLAREEDGSLGGGLEYNGDLFDAATVERMAGHLAILLGALTEEPALPLSRLPLLSPAERAQLLGWSRTAGNFQCEILLHDLFAEQAARTPEAPALAHRGKVVTYAGLAGRARRLARRLRQAGVGPEVRVAVCGERSADLVTALLAVLEAGGGFVPLDPSNPPERLALILADSGASLVLADEALAGRPPLAGCGLPILPLATEPATEEENSWTAQKRWKIPNESLAYLIYTSGSTGTPKGVAVSHANLVPLFVWVCGYFGFGPQNRVLQTLSYAFDFGLFEMWSTLFCGGTLNIPDHGGASDPVRWAAAAREIGVTTVHATPSFFREVAASGIRLPTVQVLHLGGEALLHADADRFREIVGEGCDLQNGYGPTEVTMTSLLHPLGQERSRSPLPGAPIGRPHTENAAYVLDRAGKMAPVGVPGELYLGGPGVARGYHGRPSLTAERFLPDPFSGEAGARLYRTGDLVRWLPSGDVDFLGRVDQQVKVRGYRIELGEIEAALAAHPGVAAAAVLAHEEAGERRLVAFVVASGSPPLDPAELRPYLAAKLPPPMVPAAFVDLPDLPRTPNGKLDRRALARLVPASGGELAEAFIAPRTPVEELIAGIWADLLGRGPIGAGDDFFALGGHSLQGIRLLSRLRDSFAVELEVRTLFEAPTLAALAAEVSRRLSGGAPSTGPALAPRPRGAEPPLSFAQERLWFLEQLDPGTALYNMPAAARLTGPLRPAALEAALAALERRHETLRTTFSAQGGKPVQTIAPPRGVPLPQIDLSALPAVLREAELSARTEAEARRPFDLAQGPLLRTLLFRLGEHDHCLALDLHHIVSDGWSTVVFLRELAALYEAAVQRGPMPLTPLAPLALQYADWAAWQREHLAGERLEAQLGWWRERLAGVPPLDLPSDRPRPAAATFRGRQRPIELPAATASALREASRREGVTLFMLLLAGFQALLARYARQPDVAVGSPVANRNRSETEDLIGLFVNTVVLRTDVGAAPNFRELLGQVREVTLGAYAHEETPFERIVEELQPDRDLSRTPLFQVMLVLQNQPWPELRIGDLRLRPSAPDSGVSKFDLTLLWREEEGRLTGLAESSADLFDEATVERLCRCYQSLLEAALASPEAPLAELPLLAEEERRQLLAWSRSAGRFPAAGTVHGKLERQARRTPDAPAVVADGRTWTYKDLDRWADRLALALRRRGAAPEVRVALLAERSADLVAGLFAILKAGGVLVPLDPAHPRERLALLIEDSGAALVLTQERLIADLPAGGPPVLALLEADAELDGEPVPAALQAAAPLGIPASALAYVIYTSGSTGTPKGVAVSHANAVPLLSWSLEHFRMGPHTRVLQTLSPAFDFGLWEVLTTLLAGGTLHIAGSDAADPALWAAYARDQGISTVHATPSFFREVAATGARLPEVAILHLGGEALHRGDVARMREAVGAACGIYNGYGPTEATVNCLIHRAGDGAVREAVPIGRPSAENAVYVLEPGGQPAPPGVPGELCVGGPGVARGYLGRPALTAERFVPDPFSGEPGERLYRTGDLARWLLDGIVEFLGRVDQQVKVRGFRIEPGEIEAALLAHPAVREAAVVPREGPSGTVLLAGIVPEGAAPSPADLRAFLQARLPAPMVPSQIAFLEALPRTANGKLDRRALARVEALAAAREFVPPATPVEKLIAGIWEDLLRVERVGLHDGFFELGGHSLLATQVIARLRERLGVEIAPRTLFEQPTVAGLAAAVKASHRGGGEHGSAGSSAVTRSTEEREAPLSFAQERLWFLDRLAPGNPLYNIPVYVRISGPFDPAVLAASLGEVVRRHQSLRTTFSELEGRGIQKIGPPFEVPLPLVDLSGLTGRPGDVREAEARRLAREQLQRPFDLAAGPLLRALLMQVKEGERLLLLTLHHIAADGWSVGVLFGELAALYPAVAAGSASPLPDLPVQYADFARWQRERLQGEVLDRQLDFWRDHLAGASTILELPADRPRTALQSFRGLLLPLDLPAGLGAAVRSLANRSGATSFLVLLAAFEALVGRYTGRDDALIGTPVANRGRSEIEGLIGLFVNTLALRADLSGDPSFGDLLGRARESALSAYAHQELPFEKLVEVLAPQRDLSRNPLFQVLIQLQDVSRLPGQLAPGLSLRNEELASGFSKFDLKLSFEEGPGGLSGTLDYSSDLFDEPTVRRLAGHFAALLAGATAEPGRRLSELPMLSAEEASQIASWSEEDGSRSAPLAPVHELFAQQAARAPEAPAVACAGHTLSYGQLDGLSRRLARRLRRLGAGPETTVGVHAERSVEMVAALLGVLRAGAAYVPLDPAFPAERLAFQLADSGASVLITQASLQGTLAAGRPVVLVEELAEDEEGEGLEHAADPASLAYVLYTSGSTGRPKGVAVEHRQLSSYLRGVLERLSLPAGASYATVSTIAADLGNTMIFAALATGGCLQVASAEEVSDPEALAGAFARSPVDCLKVVPSHLAALLTAAAPERALLRLPRRLLVLGGEAAPWGLIDRVRAIAPGLRILNHYGPTETTVGVLTFETGEAGAAERRAAAVPLGRPLAGTRIFLLDRHGQPVPPGVPGELHAGGTNVARGYLARPAWTAERFVPDAWSGNPGERLYRTGDLARWRAGGLFEGTVEFLGRIDQQVKVRGFRVEPGEIESALTAHAAVREAAVVLREDSPGSPALVAYLVSQEKRPEERPEVSGLRSFLAGRLPKPLLPSDFIWLDALPLTPNGKLDRAALPVPGEARREDREPVAPRSEIEALLVEIWSGVLQREDLGVFDNFFEVGGHSLLAIQVISRLREAFQVELPVRTLFEAPTVAELAVTVVYRLAEEAGDDALAEVLAELAEAPE